MDPDPDPRLKGLGLGPDLKFSDPTNPSPNLGPIKKLESGSGFS